MAGILDLLAGLQTAGNTPEPDIDVLANPRAFPNQAGTSRTFNPYADRGAIPTTEQMKEVLPRKGMFGTKGTLRDVLGILGDSLIAGNDGDPIYAPQRQREREADALYGFTDNPMAAVERLAQTGNIEQARELYEQIQRNQVQEDELAVKRSVADTTAGTKNQKAYGDGARLFGQYAGALAKYPNQAARILPVLQTIKEMYGLGDEFAIPGEGEEGLGEAFQYGGTPTQVQINTEQRQELEEMKEKGRMARDNPPAPRAAPNPTAASIAAPLLQKVQNGQPLTAGETETLNRLGYSPDKGRGRGRTPSTGAPTSGKMVIRGGKLVRQ